ncbi:MAG TPA: hypothetical protein VNM34_10725 [Verrucomicrobiae bacterium]|nr:hypothetical protein [Verrucomicrobiae bacterium]
MAIWEKFNPRERMSAIGAGLIILGWIVSLASYGVGAGTVALLGAIAVLAILYLKYAPNQNITWPAPTSLLILGISAVVALLVLLDLLRVLGVLSFFGATAILAILLEVVGAGVMAWGAWQEYQIEKPAMPNFGGGGTTSAPPPPAPSAPPPAPPMPSTPPPSAPPTMPDDTEGAPPA